MNICSVYVLQDPIFVSTPAYLEEFHDPYLYGL